MAEIVSEARMAAHRAHKERVARMESNAERDMARLRGEHQAAIAEVDALKGALEGARAALNEATRERDMFAAHNDDLRNTLRNVIGNIENASQELERSFHNVPPCLLSVFPELAGATLSSYVKLVDIKRAVADHFSVSTVDLESDRRSHAVVRPRQIAMYLSRMLTLHSTKAIGFQYGGRDHTTVLHAVNRIQRDLDAHSLAVTPHVAQLIERFIYRDGVVEAAE